MIIDIHTHVGDILRSAESKREEKKKEIKRALLQLSEYIGFRNIYLGRLNKLFTNRVSKELKACSKDAYKLLESMQENNIDMCGLVPVSPNVETGITMALANTNKSLFSLASINPSKSVDENIEMFDNYFKNGCKGLKLHPAIQNINPESYKLFAIMNAYEKYNLPVLCHTGWLPIGNERYQEADSLHFLIKSFPDIKFILAHMNLLNPDKAIDFAVKYKNVYLEPSWQPSGIIARAMKKIPNSAERILFGSDFPYSSQTTPLKNIEKAVNDKKARERMLSLNAMELFKLY